MPSSAVRIVFKETFLNRLENQVDYISLDSPTRARKFKNDLLARIREVSKNPYKYRKSIYFDSPQIRDLIFKGYTIVFRITDERIEVFGFVKYQSSVSD